MRCRLRVVAPACWLLAAAGALPGSASQEAPGYAVPESETWDLASAGGERYSIFVSRPAGEAPADGYPVLYVLDGNTVFASFAEARRLLSISDPPASRMLVVAVGYPVATPYDFKRRMKDFTPPFPKPVPAGEQAFKDWPVGGQEAFAAFLLDTLRPEVARRYKVDGRRQALFGHSLGGLFALHMLYRHPRAFHAIIAASPSIWWNDQGILAEERAFARQLAAHPPAGDAVARLLLLAGGQEEAAVEPWDASALARRLEPLSAHGLRCQLEVFPDEPHLGVPVRAVNTALRFAYDWP